MDEQHSYGHGYQLGFRAGIAAERERLRGILDDELQFVLEHGCRESDYVDAIRFALDALEVTE